jgi:hypothetical protein
LVLSMLPAHRSFIRDHIGHGSLSRKRAVLLQYGAFARGIDADELQ